AAEELAGDDLALDLGGTLVEARRPDLPVEVLEEVALLEGPCTVDLDGDVDGALRRLGGEQLRHRGGPGGRPDAVVIGGRGTVDEQPGRLHGGGDVGQLVR